MYIRIFKATDKYKGKIPNGYKFVQVFEGEMNMELRAIYNFINILSPPLFRGEGFLNGDVIWFNYQYFRLRITFNPLNIRLEGIEVKENEIYLEPSLIRFIVKEPYQAPFVAYYDKHKKNDKDTSLTRKLGRDLFSVEYNSKDKTFKNGVVCDFSLYSDLYIFQLDENGEKVSISDANINMLTSMLKEESVCAS